MEMATNPVGRTDILRLSSITTQGTQGTTTALNPGRASQTPSACIVCAKGKRKCGTERPCQRCIRLGKAQECLNGIPMESGARRKRQRFNNSQRSNTPLKKTAREPAASHDLSYAQQSYVSNMTTSTSTMNVNASIAPGISTTMYNYGYAPPMMMPPWFGFPGMSVNYGPNGELSTIPSYWNGCSQPEGNACTIPQQFHPQLPMFGTPYYPHYPGIYYVAPHMPSNLSTTIGNIAPISSIVCPTTTTATLNTSVQPAVSVTSDDGVQELAWRPEIGQHYVLAAVATMLESGVSIEEVLRMCMATVKCTSDTASDDHHTKDLPDSEAMSAMLMLCGAASETDNRSLTTEPKSPKDIAGDTTVTSSHTVEEEANDPEDHLSLAEVADIGDALTESGNGSLLQQEKEPAFEVLWRTRVSRRALATAESALGTCASNLLKKLATIPLDSFASVISVPVTLKEQTMLTIPTCVMKEIDLMANMSIFEEAKSHMKVLAENEQFADALTGFFNHACERDGHPSIVLEALASILRSKFNKKQYDAPPLFDELVGIVSFHFHQPFGHARLDAATGVPLEGWTNDAFLTLLNRSGEEMAASLGLVAHPKSNGCFYMNRTETSSSSPKWETAVEDHVDWIHPSIALPRAMAAIHAHRNRANAYKINGKYLRAIDSKKQDSAGRQYSIFTATEWILRCTDEKMRPFSQTQWFSDVNLLDTSVSVSADVGIGRRTTRVIFAGLGNQS